jgi:SHS2 domain-containing protein
MSDIRFGFEEIEHTADWALRVWAPDLPQLFIQAAQGMYHLMDVVLIAGERQAGAIKLEGFDEESLLVAFLSELLYIGEAQGLGYESFELKFEAGSLYASLEGAQILSQKKEIKAVTFHNLEIQQYDGLFWVTIVFDV